MADPTPYLGHQDRVTALLEIPLHRFLGVRLAVASDPYAGLLLEVASPALNQAELLHGGVVTALLDVASYLALIPALEASEHAVTHHISVQLLRPVSPGAGVVFQGQVVRLGRQVAFLHAEARVHGSVVATAQVTKTRLPPSDSPP